MRTPRCGRTAFSQIALESLEARALLAAEGGVTFGMIWGGHSPAADAEFLGVGEDAESPVDDPWQFGHADGGPSPELDLNDLGGAWGAPGSEDDGEERAAGSDSPIFTLGTQHVHPDAPPARPTMNDTVPLPRDPDAPVYVHGVTRVEINPVDALPIEDYGPALPDPAEVAEAVADPDAGAVVFEPVSTLATQAAAPVTIAWLDFTSSNASGTSNVDVVASFVGASKAIVGPGKFV